MNHKDQARFALIIIALTILIKIIIIIIIITIKLDIWQVLSLYVRPNVLKRNIYI
jgi:hypothetical protein